MLAAVIAVAGTPSASKGLKAVAVALLGVAVSLRFSGRRPKMSLLVVRLGIVGVAVVVVAVVVVEVEEEEEEEVEVEVVERRLEKIHSLYRLDDNSRRDNSYS